ncbi:type II secretion system F family protein, partial [Methanopyrus sp.]
VFEVVKNVAESDYGALSEEFSIVVREMDMGSTFEEAMLNLAERVDSELLRRAVRLIVRISISGGTLADVLEAVENDIREVRRIELERKSVTTMPCLTLVMGGIVCAIPVAVALGAVIGLGSGGATTMAALLPAYTLLSRYLILYPATVGFLSGLAVGIIRYGDPREGIKFALGISTASAITYNVMVKFFPTMLATLGGGGGP